MSYGIHKVTPIHVFMTLQKGKENVMVKATGIVHNFTI